MSLGLIYEPSPEGLSLRYLQTNSLVIVRVSPAAPSSQPQAQSALLLDFNIRDTQQHEHRWQALQHTLREIFTSVVVVGTMPGCQTRVNVFVLMQGQEIESAIINACMAGFMAMGLPLRMPVYADDQQAGLVVRGLATGELVYVVGRGSHEASGFGRQFRQLLVGSLNKLVRT